MPTFGAAPPLKDRPVDLVGGEPGDHRVALVILQPRLLFEDGVGRADVEAAGRQLVVGGNDRVDAVEPRIDDSGRFDRVLDAFDPDPDAGEAAQRVAERAIIQNLLHAGGRQNRHHHVDEGEFGLVRGGRGFGGVVVAHQRQHAAVRRGPGEIGVAEHVAGAVDAGTLAVPEAEHAVELAFAAHLRLLRAPQRGRGELLVEAGLEMDVGGAEFLFQPRELQVEAADRRAAIAGDEAAGVQPGAAVALFLHQQQPRDGLRAVEQHQGLLKIEAIRERDFGQRLGLPRHVIHRIRLPNGRQSEFGLCAPLALAKQAQASATRVSSRIFQRGAALEVLDRPIQLNPRSLRPFENRKRRGRRIRVRQGAQSDADHRRQVFSLPIDRRAAIWTEEGVDLPAAVRHADEFFRSARNGDGVGGEKRPDAERRSGSPLAIQTMTRDDHSRRLRNRQRESAAAAPGLRHRIILQILKRSHASAMRTARGSSAASPHADRASAMCGGAGASTATGGLPLARGISTRRACRCSVGPSSGRAP